MTGLQACGLGHTHCPVEASALRARLCSGLSAGTTNLLRSQATFAPFLHSHSRRASSLRHFTAATPAECEAAPEVDSFQPPAWQHLEALLESNHYPLCAPSPWHAGLPSTVQSGTLQQLLRPVGGLLHLAVQLEEKPPSVRDHEEEERRKRQDYYANVGDAVRTLREEIPLLFHRDLTYDIYREDVVFKDPRNTVRGKKNYQRIFGGLRVVGRIFFTRCRVDVRRIWQPELNRISLRWQFHGVPRVPWEVEGILDGVSEFKLDREGKIYEHAVNNVVLRDPPMGISPLWTALSRIFNPAPQPCPGINFEDEREERLIPAATLASKNGDDRWVILHHVLPQAKGLRSQQDLFLLE